MRWTLQSNKILIGRVNSDNFSEVLIVSVQWWQRSQLQVSRYFQSIYFDRFLNSNKTILDHLGLHLYGYLRIFCTVCTVSILTWNFYCLTLNSYESDLGSHSTDSLSSLQSWIYLSNVSFSFIRLLFLWFYCRSLIRHSLISFVSTHTHVHNVLFRYLFLER